MPHRKRNTIVSHTLWQTGAALLLSVIAGLLVNQIRSNGLSLWGSETVQEKGDLHTVSLEEAHRMYLDGKVFFLDARPAADYRLGHLPGARSLPLADLDRYLPDIMEDIPQDAVIVTYCDGKRCVLAGKLANALREFGFQDVRTLVNGWSVWVGSNLPTEKGNGKNPA